MKEQMTSFDYVDVLNTMGIGVLVIVRKI